jgi:hypothetical protein
MTQLASNPTFSGYVIGYEGRNSDHAWERNVALESIRKIIVFDRLDPSRVKLIDGGHREYNSIDIWLLPPGVEPPKPTPSVDQSFIRPPRKPIRKRK